MSGGATGPVSAGASRPGAGPRGRLLPGRLAAAVRTALVAALAAAAAAEGAGAQEAPSPPVRGWIGVGLETGGECLAGGEGACGPAVVGSVILGGPADRAGLQPGDTLIALQDREIRRGPADPAFRSLRPGAPVVLRVARDGERIRLRVVPRSHPDSLAVVRLRRPPAPEAPEPGEAPPSPSRRPGYALAVPEAVTVSGAERQVETPGPEGTGVREARVVRLVPVGQAGELSRVLVHARPDALRDAMSEAREAMVHQQEELAAARRLARELEVQAARMAAEEWRSWVDDSLRARLAAVHDSVLTAARQRLESVAAARARARQRAEVLRTLPTRSVSRDRIAGAELEALNPQLSEFFGGLEEGVLVLRVLPRTPAAEMDLRPGDVIVEAAGTAVDGVEELRAVLQEAAGAGPVDVKWFRKGQEHSGRLER